MTANDGPSEYPDDEEHAGVLARVARLLRELSDADPGETRRRTGRIDTGRTRVDYEYSVSVGLDAIDRNDDTISRGDDGPPDGTGDAHAAARSPSIETRRVSETERVVIADLPGVSEGNLDVTFDDEAGTVTIWDGPDRIERVTLSDPSVTVTDVTLNNQVLRVTLRRDGAASNGESS